jgi:hypothetical protein
VEDERAKDRAALERAAAALSIGDARDTRDTRTRMREQVFRPSHILPTMTIEQAGEIEHADMLRRQTEEAERAYRRQREREAMTADEIEDEELAKARYWDDFKDDNPFGSGNSKLRPCG